MEKVLIVDDEKAMRRLLRINLTDRYEIIETGNPEQALALAMQDKPSAILLDLRMAKYSGFELCRTLNSMSSTHLIPLVIVSGEAGATTKSLCKELGAVAYFEKPIDFEALRAGLAHVLRTARPERRREVRVHLRVRLKLQGVDIHEALFEEDCMTEDVSPSGFLCSCPAELKEGSRVEVHLTAGGTKYVGQACVVRFDGTNMADRRYGFQFVGKQENWILR